MIKHTTLKGIIQQFNAHYTPHFHERYSPGLNFVMISDLSLTFLPKGIYKLYSYTYVCIPNIQLTSG